MVDDGRYEFGKVPGAEGVRGRRRARPYNARMVRPESADTWLALVRGALPVEDARQWATRPDCGAVVVFTGIVRDHSEGREGVTGLTYEAWEDRALERLRAVADAARDRWPDVARVAAVHRLGDVPLGEPTVVVVVSAPHRDAAFEAARFCIDTLKETVPIWKREHWPGGSEWAAADHELRSAGGPERPVPSGKQG